MMPTGFDQTITFALLTMVDGHPETIPLPGTENDTFSVSAAWKQTDNFRHLAVTVTNTSKRELCFQRAFIRAVFAAGPYEYYAQKNRWGVENRGNWTPLDEKGVILSHKQGRTTEGNTPFCAIRRIGRPAGTSFHLLPLGNWRIRLLPLLTSNSEPQLAVDLGISDENLAFRLAPGETWALPHLLVHDFADFAASMAELHVFLRHDYPVSSTRLPVLFNTWFDRFDQLDLPHLRTELAAAQAIGCEAFVIDAGWFGADGPGWSQVGDWREKSTMAFHGKMQAFADEVRAAGLDFGLWIEPERYAAGIPVRQAHPEWFVPIPTTDWYCIDLAIPAAYAYLKGELTRLIETYGLRYIKTDMNAMLGPDASGAELYHYQTRFFGLIDELRAEHPGLIIENCSSGAMRSDLETLRHFDVFFPSDNVNPFTMLETIHGFWQRMLPGRIMRWLTFRELKEDLPRFGATNTIITPAEATWVEFECCDLESLLIANFTGGLYGFSGDLASLGDSNRNLVRKYVDLFKRKRTFMLQAAGHWLEDQPRLQALELEYHGEAIVSLVYIASDAVAERTLYPVKLDPNASYRTDNTTRTGRDIMQNGLTFKLENNMHSKWRARMVVLEKE